jgi:arylformamidase
MIMTGIGFGRWIAAVLTMTGLFSSTDFACAGVRMVPNVRYAQTPGVDAKAQSLDIYLPDPAPATPMPVVLWVHGGGWSIGDKSNQMQHKPGLFTRAGYCFVSINYRLSPFPANNNPDRIMYPVHEQDVASAVAWVHEHIGTYGGDPERIALMGHSAGAHLVAIVSTDESYLAAHGLTLSVIKGTASVDTEGYDIVSTMADGPVKNLYRNAFGDDPVTWAAASPINHLALDKGLPTFLLVARGDAFRRGMCNDFATALRNAGTEAAVVDAGTYSHRDVNVKIGAPGETVITPPLMDFLQQCFEKKR